ncbi:hypothetical protein P7K49_029292 [Saguinus oedipus]|uniref:Uncharacterized protein n=1 Tax=Saguinus oedipus TaxID=9490 RepID=A0ABQ9U6S7_SAGOE|nr:hypothetical protein P7K49_029292 [Saguinus oedipus]
MFWALEITEHEPTNASEKERKPEQQTQAINLTLNQIWDKYNYFLLAPPKSWTDLLPWVFVGFSEAQDHEGSLPQHVSETPTLYKMKASLRAQEYPIHQSLNREVQTTSSMAYQIPCIQNPEPHKEREQKEERVRIRSQGPKGSEL